MKKALTEIIKFNEERDWDQFHSPENLAKSIAIEAGELLECFQWGPDYDLLMSDKLGVDAETIILQKLEQNRKKYPVEKAKGKSTKYDQL